MKQRKIEFRFWSALNNVMYNNDYLEDYTIKEILEWEGHLMQYINKDLNGVKLFEGDIVQHTNEEFYQDEEPIIAVIKLTEPKDLYDTFGWDFGNYVKLLGYNINFDLPEDAILLGNIYQNPELINQLQNVKKN